MFTISSSSFMEVQRLVDDPPEKIRIVTGAASAAQVEAAIAETSRSKQSCKFDVR